MPSICRAYGIIIAAQRAPSAKRARFNVPAVPGGKFTLCLAYAVLKLNRAKFPSPGDQASWYIQGINQACALHMLCTCLVHALPKWSHRCFFLVGICFAYTTLRIWKVANHECFLSVAYALHMHLCLVKESTRFFGKLNFSSNLCAYAVHMLLK